MSGPHRRTGALMRFALALGATLTFASGVQLYVLTDHTDRFFAWTIGAGSSATIMGAFYWTACVLSFLSWRRQPWVRARVGVPGVTVFLWLTLLVTLQHLDAFHFAGPASAVFAAWAWLVIYVGDPVLVTVALWRQSRSAGQDPPAARDLPAAYRLMLWSAGVVFAVLGLVMVAAPSLAVSAAAWPLTPLTSGAIGAWVTAMGGVFAMMAWEDDADRIQPAAVASLVLPTLIAIGVARYADQFTLGPGGVAQALLVAWVAGIGVVGLRLRSGRARRAPQHPNGEGPK